MIIMIIIVIIMIHWWMWAGLRHAGGGSEHFPGNANKMNHHTRQQQLVPRICYGNRITPVRA